MNKIQRLRLTGELSKLLAFMESTDLGPIQRMRTAVKAKQLADRLREAMSTVPQPGDEVITLGGRQIPVRLGPWEKKAGNKLVLVDAGAFDAAFHSSDRGDFYVGPGGAGGIGSRYSDFGEFVKDAGFIEASDVAVSAGGGVTFGNGRHRYAYMRDHGVNPIPVAMDGESADRAAKFGLTATSAKRIVEAPTNEPEPNVTKSASPLWTREEAISFAKASASVAWDQRNSGDHGPTPEDEREGHKDNVRDTLVENRASEFEPEAFAAFDKEWGRLAGSEAPADDSGVLSAMDIARQIGAKWGEQAPLDNDREAYNAATDELNGKIDAMGLQPHQETMAFDSFTMAYNGAKDDRRRAAKEESRAKSEKRAQAAAAKNAATVEQAGPEGINQGADVLRGAKGVRAKDIDRVMEMLFAALDGGDIYKTEFDEIKDVLSRATYSAWSYHEALPAMREAGITRDSKFFGSLGGLYDIESLGKNAAKVLAADPADEYAKLGARFSETLTPLRAAVWSLKDRVIKGRRPTKKELPKLEGATLRTARDDGRFHLYRGACQMCNRDQAIERSKGVLAYHGYTTERGFFNGACSGSKQLPYEKSCEFLNDQIPRQRTRVVALRMSAEEAAVNRSPNVTFYRQEGRYVVPVACVIGARPDGIAKATVVASGKLFDMPYIFDRKKPEQAIELYWTNRARQLNAEADAGDDWVKHAEERVANWKLAPLTPMYRDIPEDLQDKLPS